MNEKIINDIVWWIPFKKLRNAVREYLLKSIKIDNKLEEINERMNVLENNLHISYSQLGEINNNIGVINNNIHNNYIDLYSKLKRVTPQPYIDFIEIHLAEHCNLNCYSCNHFSQLAEEEYYDINIFENDIKRLYELTNGLINRFQLMGGEPLLNKNCKDYFYIVRKYFKNSLIWLITNGILLNNQDENFWIACKENNIEIRPTKYPININWESINELCSKYNIVLHFYNDISIEKESVKSILNLDGNLNPYNNFINCFIANECLFLRHGKLFTCGLISNIRHFNKYFNKNLEVTEHDYIDIYKAKNYNEILQFLAKPAPFCRYCDITKWYGIGKWERSKKEINEYL